MVWKNISKICMHMCISDTDKITRESVCTLLCKNTLRIGSHKFFNEGTYMSVTSQKLFRNYMHQT